ncbi:MAG: type II toxin-antitoxin system RatA family toxin [Rhizobiaceae bacterium]
MPHFEEHHRVEHRAGEMFDLVADIDRYPEFVPLCQSLETRQTRERGGKEIRTADMTVGYMAIRETFTCQVVLDRETSTITASYIDGPFKYLENKWTFEPAGESSCIIHFVLDYEFKSRALGMLMGSMFDRAFSRFVTAFEQRADERYG